MSTNGIKINITLFFLLILNIMTYGQFSNQQQSHIDSLNQILKKNTSTYQSAKAYLELSEILYVSSTDTIIYLCQKSSTLTQKGLLQETSTTQKEKLEIILGESYNNLGYAYMVKGNNDLALQYYNRALVLCSKINHTEGMVNINNNMGMLYHNINKDSLALVYYQKGLAENKILKNIYHDAMLFNNIGAVYQAKSDYEKSIMYYTKSIQIFKNTDNLIGASSLYNNIGRIYKSQGNIPEAIAYLHKSLKISETLNNVIDIAVILGNIGELHQSQGDLNKALTYYKKALKIDQMNNKKGTSSMLLAIGEVYFEQGLLDMALSNYLKSLPISNEVNNKENKAIALHRIGKIHEIKGYKSRAIKLYKQCLAVYDEIEYNHGLAAILSTLGNFYFNEQDIKQAKKYAVRSLFISQKIAEPKSISEASMLLEKIYIKQENWKKAYKMKSIYMTMQDSINNSENEKLLIEQEAAYTLEKKEYEISNLAAQNQIQELKLTKSKLAIYLISLISILGIIISYFSYQNYKKGQNVNKLLQKQNEEKNAMLKEIHHRVKNNLQVVNSLLRFQSNQIDDKETIAIFKEAQQRVVSMALLHEKMYNSEDLEHINVQEHITLLAEDLVKNYTIEKKIKLDLDIDQVNMDIKTLVPLGLIINEIIANALKYAFTEVDGGIIKVHLKQYSNQEYKMIIGDNGKGLFNNNKKEGLGTKLIEIFTLQLNGIISKLNQKGTIYQITFPKG